MQAFEARAEILEVDKKNRFFWLFCTVIHTKYKPQTTVYHKKDKKLYKKLVFGIYGQCKDGTFDLVVRLNDGEDISTKEIGHSLFLNLGDAR